MNRPARLGGALLWLLLIGFCPALAEPPVLGTEQAERAGIAVGTLHVVHKSASVPALGAVLDPAPLLALSGRIAEVEAQVAGAEAKVVLQKQEMAQAEALYRRNQVISLANYQKAAGDLAATQAMLIEAQAKRTSLLAQTEADWGGAMGAALRTNSAPLPDLAAGKAMLVGLSLPPGKRVAEPPREVAAEAAEFRFPLHLIGPVRRMLGGYPGQAFLYQGPAQQGVPVGTIVSASFPAGPPRVGVLVPWSAVLWQGGRAVVFRAAAGDRFEPVPIATDVPTGGGYFVSALLAPGDRIALRGAALLPAAGEGTRRLRGEDSDDEE